MARKAVAELSGQETDQRGPNLPMVSATLSGIQEQIRFADSKAAFIAALNAVLFGFVGRSLDKLNSAGPDLLYQHIAFWVGVGLLTLYLIATLVSVVTVVIAVRSRFGELAPQSRVFFGHIAKQYGKDYGKYAREAGAMTDSDWFEQVSGQIVETSHIALTKHKYVCRAALSILIALALWGLSLIAMALVPVAAR